MKVRVEMTLDIDAEAWALEYGVSPSEVREDVKEYVRHNVYSDFAARELIRTAEQ